MHHFRNSNLWAGIFFLVFSLVIFFNSLSYSYTSRLGGGIGPGFLPIWVSLFLAVASVAYIFSAIRKDKLDFSEVLPDKEGVLSVVKLFLYIVLFMVIVKPVGFTLAMAIMLFLMFMGYLKVLINVAVSAGLAVFLFLVFAKWLMLPRPVNMFGW
jgi:hypothetical protein